MTTTMTDIADLARIINEQPEWRDTIRGVLLGQELLALPQLVASFVQAVDERFARLEADVADLKAGQARLETALAEFMEATNRRLDQLEAGQARLEAVLVEFMEATNRRLDQLEAGQARLETALAEFMEATNRRLDQLEAGQARLEADFDRMKTTQTQMQGTLGRLVGAELEREVHANIISIASRELGLNRARILQSKIVARGPELQDYIDDAEEQGVISAEQGSHLELSDIIIRARRKSDGQECYAVLEVSAGIRNSDITRARDRAQTLADIQDLPVIPAVVGGAIAAQQRNLADRDGVQVIVTLRMAPRPLDQDDGTGARQ